VFFLISPVFGIFLYFCNAIYISVMHFNVQSYWQTIIFIIVLQPLNAYCASERSINFPFWPNGSAVVSLNMMPSGQSLDNFDLGKLICLL